MDKDTRNVTVRLPVRMQKKLEQVAAGVDPSRNWLVNQANWLINQAIENYLEVYDWQKNVFVNT